jgi:hypothetical protein
MLPRQKGLLKIALTLLMPTADQASLFLKTSSTVFNATAKVSPSFPVEESLFRSTLPGLKTNMNIEPNWQAPEKVNTDNWHSTVRLTGGTGHRNMISAKLRRG